MPGMIGFVPVRVSTMRRSFWLALCFVSASWAEAGSAEVPPEETYMKVDRPFLVAIRDDVTGTILFLGAINDPQATGATP